MSSPQYNTTYELNERTFILWGRELATAGTVTASWTKEEHGTFSWSPTRNIWVNNLRVGFPSTRLGTYETWHAADVTLSVPHHPGGLSGYGAVNMLGDVTNVGTADTVSGTGDPYTHTVKPGTNGTRQVTFSFAFVSLMDKGATPALQFTYGTLKSWKLSGGGGAPIMCEIQATCYWPTSVATPSGSWHTPNTYTFGFQTQHQLVNASGTTYTATVLDADVTITRQLNVIPSYNNNGVQNPVDIVPLDLSLQANATLFYDGMGGGSGAATPHYTDYLAYLKSGSASNVNKLIWGNDASSHSIEIDFGPAAWSTDSLQTGAGVMTCNATLDAEQDFSSATQASPAMTIAKQIVIKNEVSTAMAA